jgi:hypothetical protein
MDNSGTCRTSNAKVGINHKIAAICEGEYEPLYKFYWKLAGVDCLLDVVVLDVRDHPNIARIFTQWVAGVLALLRSFERFLARILLGHSNGIKIEDVIVAFGEPDDGFVTPTQTVLAVQSVLEAPDDAVTQLHPEFFANLIDVEIEWENLAVSRYVIPSLPTQATIVCESAMALLEGLFLLLKVVLEHEPLLILLANVVWGRRNDEPCLTIGNLPQKCKAITVEQGCLGFRVVSGRSQQVGRRSLYRIPERLQYIRGYTKRQGHSCLPLCKTQGDNPMTQIGSVMLILA